MMARMGLSEHVPQAGIASSLDLPSSSSPASAYGSFPRSETEETLTSEV